MVKYNQESFIAQVTKVHRGKYTYNKASYLTTNDLVVVTCKDHGDFSVRASNHLAGSGCVRCAQLKTGKLLRKTTEQFIQDAKRVHGDRYDYSLVDYATNVDKVKIICKDHGEWLAPPNKHLLGTGCWSCAQAGFDSNKPGHFYILRHESTIKVGITNREVPVRINEVSKSAGKQFDLVTSYSMQGKECADIERQLLALLREVATPVADKYSGSTECFTGVTAALVVGMAEERINKL